MTRPVQAFISRTAIAANIAIVRRTAPRSRVWAVLKADAYGHGLHRVAGDDSPAVREADGIAILDVEAAVALREVGWTRPILLLEGCFDASDLEVAARLDVTITVHEAEQLAMLEASGAATRLDVYLKMNTGMNRLGFAPAAYRGAWERLRASPRVATITAETHFANADRDDGVAAPLAAFDAATRGLDGDRPVPMSVANSAAILAHPESHRDWVRPGVMIYGATPFATRSAAEFGLVPAMRLTSRLIAVQDLKAGDAIGYGHRFVADRDLRIGVVACGYADGYPRVAATGTPAAVDGVRTRLVGRVSMDMLTVDLTAIPQASVGSEVELWGPTVAVDDVAQSAGTVGYELLCAVAPRVRMTTVD